MPVGAGMPAAPPMDGLHIAIVVARDKQMRARIAWARSANADTIHACKLADRELDVRLDQLLLRIKAAT